MKIRLFKICILILTASILTPCANGAQDAFEDPYAGYDEAAALDMDLEENLATPKVGKNEHKAIVKYVGAQADRLKNDYIVELMRNGEVMIVTVPTDKLFFPNDTLLMPEGPKVLKPLLRLLSDPEMYKLVFSVHTDDTGSPEYISELASARSQTIYSWLIDDQKIDERQFIINYDMGEIAPLVPNDTRANRSRNRRIEFFFVPGPKMITLAHNRKLKP